MKIAAIVQARLGSIRLPNKSMMKICGKPMLGLLLKRLSLSKNIDQIIVAVPKGKRNEPIVKYVKKNNFEVFQGSEKNVLNRYLQAAKKYKADVIVRITADCPLADPKLIDNLINVFKRTKKDYICNALPPTYPDGLDIEVFNYSTLKSLSKYSLTNHDKEHVTSFIQKSGKFSILNVPYHYDYSNYRWTVDEPEDFNLIKKIFEFFKPRINFTWQEVLKLAKNKPKLFNINKHIKANEGKEIDDNQKLWKRAKRIIPGGNMLLSKKPEMFLPNRWPTYFSKAKGCKIWDLTNKEYYDMSFMGVGTNILGYGHPEVDDAVRSVVKKGNMSTLNCPEEVYLSEKLIELHPWAEMVKLARSGGEANSIAVRIARAASGKEKIAFCGYHGWHDWYLSANLKNKQNLTNHLISELEPKGVPESLKNTAFPFSYNRFDELEKIVKKNDIGIIKIEVSRNYKPKNDFLKKIRNLASKKGIILIFDECSSGFRQTYGGLHKLYNVEPDMAIFGKALGNGYAITAVIGKKKIMESAKSTFISSTFWTERIGPVAGLKTLEVMKRTKSWEVITNIGRKIEKGWKNLAKKYEINIATQGLPAFINFRILSKDWPKYKTLISQEMLKKGFLAGNSVYACTEHSDKIIKEYFEQLEPIFKTIKECESGRSIDKLLEGPVSYSDFKRLN